MKISKCPICGAKPEAYAYFSSAFMAYQGKVKCPHCLLELRGSIADDEQQALDNVISIWNHRI